MRIVLDTNVLLSACLKPAGLEARLVDLSINGTLQACVTPETWAEYQDVLLRDKFISARPRAQHLLQALQNRILEVTPGDRQTAATDEDDNRFLECAVAAEAEYLVTGNLRHYPASHGATQVLNARGFFNLHPTPGLK